MFYEIISILNAESIFKESLDSVFAQRYDYWVFFFQAEDCIRDGHVTGVQTCALPISKRSASGSTRGTTRVRSTRTSGLVEVATVKARSVNRTTKRPTGRRSVS